MNSPVSEKVKKGQGGAELATMPAHELEAVSGPELVAAYEQFRDEPASAGKRHYYPNIERLHATPFEREKDRREIQARLQTAVPEMQAWYAEAAEKPCTWWLDNHIVARHAVKNCMNCGVCVASCPAAEFYEDYNPRRILDAVLDRDEGRLLEILGSEMLWYCGQCGSCKPKCTRENNLMGLISSLRTLSQLKGLNVQSARGRQQYGARHLWGGNFWNRGCSLYFRNVSPETHREFGPRFALWQGNVVEQMRRIGAEPDQDGLWCSRKIHPETLEELRRCVQWGGTLALWERIETSAQAAARARDMDIDTYHDTVRSEG